MTSVPLALPVLGLFLLQTPERAQEFRQPAQTFTLAEAVPRASPAVPGEKAFSQLFEHAQRAARQAHSRRGFANQKPERKIVCGMVVIEADPTIDPKILVPPAPDSGGAKIRRIVPPACIE